MKISKSFLVFENYQTGNDIFRDSNFEERGKSEKHQDNDNKLKTIS